MSSKDVVRDKGRPQKNSSGPGGQKALFIVVGLLLVALGAPVVLIHFLKSPQSGQQLSVFGYPFINLIYFFWISAAVISYSALFFLRARLVVIFPVFLLSLFSCFPLIVGLRNRLTLQEAIIDSPLFSDWPFFLKPAYILLVVLIPAGTTAFLFLQFKSIFSKKKHTYVYALVAVYLGSAALLGGSILSRADQPNLTSFFIRQRDTFPERGYEYTDSLPSQETPLVMEVPGNVRRYPIKNIETDLGGEKQPADTNPQPLPENMGQPALVAFDQKLKQLSDKMDLILEALDLEKPHPPGLENIPEPGQSTLEAKAPAGHPEIMKALPPSTGKVLPEDLNQSLELVSAPLSHMFEVISKLEVYLSKQSENEMLLDTSGEALQQNQTQLPATKESVPGPGVVDIEALGRQLQQLSEKMDHVWEKLPRKAVIPKGTVHETPRAQTEN